MTMNEPPKFRIKPTAPNKQLRFQGALEKQGRIKTWSWKKYWFILADDHLCYFKENKVTSRHGSIDLAHVRYVCKQIPTSRGFPFELETSSRVHVLCAETAELCDQWVGLLQKAMMIGCQKGNSIMSRPLCNSIIEDNSINNDIITTRNLSPTVKYTMTDVSPVCYVNLQRSPLVNPAMCSNDQQSSEPSIASNTTRNGRRHLPCRSPVFSTAVSAPKIPVHRISDRSRHLQASKRNEDCVEEGMPKKEIVKNLLFSAAFVAADPTPAAVCGNNNRANFKSSNSVATDRHEEDDVFSSDDDCWQKMGQGGSDILCLASDSNGQILPRGAKSSSMSLGRLDYRYLQSLLNGSNGADSRRHMSSDRSSSFDRSLSTSNSSSSSEIVSSSFAALSSPDEVLDEEQGGSRQDLVVPRLPHPRLEMTWGTPFDAIRLFLANNRDPTEVYATPHKSERGGKAIAQLKKFLLTLE